MAPMTAAVAQWRPLALKYGAEFNTHPNLILAVISVESEGVRTAKGRAGEIGLMQLMPATILTYQGAMKERGVSTVGLDPWDPDTNVKVGSWYLGSHIPWELQKYGHEDTIENRIWAYNAGIGNVNRKVLPASTKAYIQRVREFMTVNGVPVVDGGASSPRPPVFGKVVYAAGAALLLFALWNAVQKTVGH